MSITALTRDSGFSLDAGAWKKGPRSRSFLVSHVFSAGLPTPQSGDAHRSPKFRRRRNRGASLWSAVRITALTRDLGFSLDAGASKKGSRSRPFLVSHVSSAGLPTPQSGDAHRSPKFRLRRNRGASLWSAVSITALTRDLGFSLDAGASKKGPSSRPFLVSHVFSASLPTPQNQNHGAPLASHQ